MQKNVVLDAAEDVYDNEIRMNRKIHQKKVVMNKYRNSIIQYGIFFVAVFVIMTTVVGTLVFYGSFYLVLQSESELAYTRAYNVSEMITEMEAHRFLIEYWQENPETIINCSEVKLNAASDAGRMIALKYDVHDVSMINDTIAGSMDPEEQKNFAVYAYSIIKSEMKMINHFEKMTLSGPMLIGVSDDGTKSVLISADDVGFKAGDTVTFREKDKTLYALGKYDLSHAVDDLVHISAIDGTDFVGVAYPIDIDRKTRAIVLVGVSEDVVHSLSRKVTDKIVAAVVNIALVSGIVLLLLLHFGLIKPILKVQSGLREYTGDFNTEGLIDKMKEIKVRNEVGCLADDISIVAGKARENLDAKMALSAEKARLGSEMSFASEIQRSMLPVDFPDRDSEKRFELYASMEPAREVGGDMYDFFFIDDDHLALLIADVSGKGIPAALFMMEAMTMIRDKAVAGKTPAGILSEVNTKLTEHSRDRFFVTTWLMIIELSTGKALEANAGHEKPAFASGGGKYKYVENRHSLALAVMDDIKIDEFKWELKSGDRIFVYTDGVTEAEDWGGQLFGKKRLIETLNEVTGKSQEEILSHVRECVGHFVGDVPGSDDLTMLGFTYYGT